MKRLFKTAIITLAISVAALVVMLVLFYPAIFSIPPLATVPIDLSKAGNTAEADITLEQNDQITLELSFEVNDKPNNYQQLVDLLENYPRIVEKRTPSLAIPIHLYIEKHAIPQNLIFHDKAYVTNGIYGNSGKVLYRLITDLRINKGFYHIQITNLNSFPELSNNRIEFRIRFVRRPK